MRGWWSALGSVTTRSLGSLNAAWIWLVKVPGVKRPAIGVAPVAAANQHSPQASILGGNDADVHWVFSDSNGMSCQQKLLQGSLQIYDVDA